MPASGVSDDAIARARRLLTSADHVLVMTGAGMSAESGVPTFRGPDGLWRRYRPEDLATPEAFERDPKLVWEWYSWRRERVAACRPNPGHVALARWMVSRPGVTLVTQNVDGLHEAAARDLSAEIRGRASLPIALHGTLLEDRCSRCGYRRPTEPSAEVPHCPSCGARMRPDVVWFGEPLPAEGLAQAIRAARTAEACLVVGTSALVYPAVGVVAEAAASGAALVVVNPEPTTLDTEAACLLRAPAGVVLPALLES